MAKRSGCSIVPVKPNLAQNTSGEPRCLHPLHNPTISLTSSLVYWPAHSLSSFGIKINQEILTGNCYLRIRSVCYAQAMATSEPKTDLLSGISNTDDTQALWPQVNLVVFRAPEKKQIESIETAYQKLEHSILQLKALYDKNSWNGKTQKGVNMIDVPRTLDSCREHISYLLGLNTKETQSQVIVESPQMTTARKATFIEAFSKIGPPNLSPKICSWMIRKAYKKLAQPKSENFVTDFSLKKETPRLNIENGEPAKTPTSGGNRPCSSKTAEESSIAALFAHLQNIWFSFYLLAERSKIAHNSRLLEASGGRFVLETIQFMHNFGLITPTHLRKFFELKDTLHWTVEYLLEYTSVLQVETWSSTRYMNPDWLDRKSAFAEGFLLFCAREFDQELKKRLNRLFLTITSSRLKGIKQKQIQPQEASEFDAILACIKKSFQELPFVSGGTVNDEVTKMINLSSFFFRRQPYSTDMIKKREFLVNLQLLKFLTIYEKENFTKCFENNKELIYLEMQIDLVYTALEANQVKQQQDEKLGQTIEMYKQLGVRLLRYEKSESLECAFDEYTMAESVLKFTNLNNFDVVDIEKGLWKSEIAVSGSN
ncbi:hypothetical protein O181_065199 [Austropuccinia psidii MF-1]|uniref:Uncharacterized protein n=1 Tax=Austropuccinia psidii MF-1 TaxID=1389203 RepID=A0A9Q3ER03_9BASI|nr:hypothetical protein [Austropuccinia psidii MF-1]